MAFMMLCKNQMHQRWNWTHNKKYLAIPCNLSQKLYRYCDEGNFMIKQFLIGCAVFVGSINGYCDEPKIHEIVEKHHRDLIPMETVLKHIQSGNVFETNGDYFPEHKYNRINKDLVFKDPVTGKSKRYLISFAEEFLYATLESDNINEYVIYNTQTETLDNYSITVTGDGYKSVLGLGDIPVEIIASFKTIDANNKYVSLSLNATKGGIEYSTQIEFNIIGDDPKKPELETGFITVMATPAPDSGFEFIKNCLGTGEFSGPVNTINVDFELDCFFDSEKMETVKMYSFSMQSNATIDMNNLDTVAFAGTGKIYSMTLAGKGFEANMPYVEFVNKHIFKDGKIIFSSEFTDNSGRVHGNLYEKDFQFPISTDGKALISLDPEQQTAKIESGTMTMNAPNFIIQGNITEGKTGLSIARFDRFNILFDNKAAKDFKATLGGWFDYNGDL